MMKKILSNVMLLLFCSTILTGCFGSCGDWNCSGNPRWYKKADECDKRNFEIVKQTVGYKDYGEVQDSEIGQHISVQCFRNAGRFDIKKDKKYGHLFAK